MDYKFVKKQFEQRPKVYQEYVFNDGVRIGRGAYGQVYKAIQNTKSPNKSSEKNQYFALKEVEMSSYSSSTCRELAVSIMNIFFHYNFFKYFYDFFFLLLI